MGDGGSVGPRPHITTTSFLMMVNHYEIMLTISHIGRKIDEHVGDDNEGVDYGNPHRNRVNVTFRIYNNNEFASYRSLVTTLQRLHQPIS